jgi:hypothetical protein
MIGATRRRLIGSACASLTLRSTKSIAAVLAPVRLGAIRYDAWYDGETQIGTSAWYASHELDRPRWQTRAPFFAKRIAPDRMLIKGSPSDVEAELVYAAHAHINFWAFGWYPSNSSYRTAWNYYQSSSKKHLVNWCILIGLGSLAHQFPTTKELISFFGQRSYERVVNRPLLILLYEKAASLGDARVAINEIRRACQAAGVGDPYILLQAPTATLASKTKRIVGADAVGCYAVRPYVPGPAPYSALSRETAVMNETLRRTQDPVVPLIMSGWDRRPQIDYSSPFNHPEANPNDPINGFILPGKPDEIAAQAVSVVSAVARDTVSFPAQRALMYSWNEFAEGGGICPTWSPAGPNTEIVDGFARRLTN